MGFNSAFKGLKILHLGESIVGINTRDLNNMKKKHAAVYKVSKVG